MSSRSVTNEQACARRKSLARLTRPIFLKFSDQKEDARCSFYFLNLPYKASKKPFFFWCFPTPNNFLFFFVAQGNLCRLKRSLCLAYILNVTIDHFESCHLFLFLIANPRRSDQLLAFRRPTSRPK